MTEIRVRDISEFELIRRLTNALPDRARQSPNLELAIGDDAAAASIASGELLVVSADTLTEGVHFRTDWSSWESLGHKSLAVNLSDLAAMGATPVIATVCLSLTGDESVTDLERMYLGIGNCAIASRCVIGGGDVTRTPGPLSISVTAIGETRNRRLLRRDSANPFDVIWVTGSIGAAAAGLELERLPDEDNRKRASTAKVLIDALHHPMPRTAAGQSLARIGVRCAMDLSDGLCGDLYKILVASDVDAELTIADLPIPAAVFALFRDQAPSLALYGGDDFELLFTAPQSASVQIQEGLELLGVRATPIGQIRARSGNSPALYALEPHGKRSILQPRGFDHFATGEDQRR